MAKEEPTALFAEDVVVTYNDALFEAKLRKDAKEKDKPKYSVAYLITHEKAKQPWVQILRDAIDAAAIQLFGKKEYEEMIDEGRFESPFHTDIGSKGFDKAVFKYRLSSSANVGFPPKVKRRDGSIILPEDAREVYAGCRARLQVAVRAYGGGKTGWKPGASIDLRHFQKRADGPRLALGSDKDELGGIEGDDEEEQASLGSMQG